MLCGCLDWDTSTNQGTRENSSGLFPGNRRSDFVKTGGNALAAPPNSSPPLISPISANVAPTSNATELVAVRVPQGYGPGDLICVVSPDGSGRQITVVVPQNVTTGQTFMVEFPPGSAGTSVPTVSTHTSTNTNINPNFQNDKHSATLPALPTAKPYVPNAFDSTPTATATPIPPQEDREPTTTTFSTPLPPPVVAPLPVPLPVKTTAPAPSAPPPSAPPPSPELWSNHNNASHMNDDTLILVQVPPGVCAGQTLHVQAPGSNDLIAVTVPPGNVKQFHVSVPKPQQEQLILVNVPPNTPPGTTLHVCVPNSDQIIAAQVPPGNVQQFHVSYKPKHLGHTSGNNNVVPSVASTPQYAQHQPQSTFHPSQQPSWNNNRPTNNNNYAHMNNGCNRMNQQRPYNRFNQPNNQSSNTGGGAMSYVAPVLAGAALMGAAGYMIGHHNNHQGYDNNNADYGGYDNHGYDNDNTDNGGYDNDDTDYGGYDNDDGDFGGGDFE